MTWLAECVDETRNIVHVSPLGDVIEHDTTSFGACVCGPRPSYKICGWLFVHHALDCRT